MPRNLHAEFVLRLVAGCGAGGKDKVHTVVLAKVHTDSLRTQQLVALVSMYGKQNQQHRYFKTRPAVRRAIG